MATHSSSCNVKAIRVLVQFYSVSYGLRLVEKNPLMSYGSRLKDVVAKRPYTIDAAALGDKISGSKRHLAYWGILSIDAYFLISYLLVHPYMDAASIV